MKIIIVKNMRKSLSIFFLMKKSEHFSYFFEQILDVISVDHEIQNIEAQLHLLKGITKKYRNTSMQHFWKLLFKSHFNHET